MHAVGLTAGDFSVALTASPRTVMAWLEESVPPIKKASHKDRLRDLLEVARFIVDDGTIAFQEADWLRDPHRMADFATPLELIGEERWQEAGRLYCDDVAIKPPRQFRSDPVERGKRKHSRPKASRP